MGDHQIPGTLQGNHPDSLGIIYADITRYSGTIMVISRDAMRYTVMGI